MPSNAASSSRYQKNIHLFEAFIPKWALYLFIVGVFSIAHFSLKEPWTNDHYQYLNALANINQNQQVNDLYQIIVAYFFILMGHNYITSYGAITLANSLLLFLINKTILSSTAKVTLIEGVFICFPFLYLAFYSKEIITAFLVIQLTFSNRKLLNVISLGLFTGFLRSYWGLIAIQLFIFSYFSKIKKIRPGRFFLTSILSISAFIMMNDVFTSNPTSSIREKLNSFEFAEKVPSSIIHNLNLFSNTFLNDITNYYYSLTLIYFPLIHINFQLNHIAFVTFQMALVYVLHFKISPSNDLYQRRAISIISAVIFTLILFEPDLGSFLRHESIVCFLIGYLLIQSRLKLARKAANLTH